MPYDHASQIRLYLDHMTEKDHDIYLISEEGEQVGTHKVVLRLFSTVLSDIINQQEPVSHISVPASGSVLNHFVGTLSTGVAITSDAEEVKTIAEVADTLGLGYVDWQVGTERKRKKKDIVEIKIEDESTEGFVFEDGPKEEDCQNVVKLEILPDILGGKVDLEVIKTANNTFSFASSQERLKCDMGILTAKYNISTDNRFDCDICSKSFTSKKYFRKHVKDMHEVHVKNEKRTPCTDCQKFHGFNPKNDQHYDCDQCGKTFYGSELFKHHRNIKHGIRVRPARIVEAYVADDPNHCHLCKESCKSKTDLIYHQDTKHLEVKTDFLSCRFCDRKIKRKQKRFFLEHLRKHTGESPEVCSYCGKSFKQKKALQNHERLHTGEKPYKCEFCFTAFTQRSGLTSHQKSRNVCQQLVDNI